MVVTDSASAEHFRFTSGYSEPVWVHTERLADRPQFSALKEDLETDVCIVGGGIAGISTAFELVRRGKNVVLLEAREMLSGETARTTGHLSDALDNLYHEIARLHGKKGAAVAAESHRWAINHVGEVSRELGIDCEYRQVPGYRISQFTDATSEEYRKDVDEKLHPDFEAAKATGLLNVCRKHHTKVRGWDGHLQYSGDAVVYPKQGVFHPTKYLVGLLRWLKKQPNFRCYTNTRVMTVEEHTLGILGRGERSVTVSVANDGPKVTCKHALWATCVPLQKLAVVCQMEYNRTYAIAVRIPKGSVEDCCIYDTADPYMYVRLTPCDPETDYLVVGGLDHKVGQEAAGDRYESLERWTRDRFAHAGAVDFKWSGQIFEPFDALAFIGPNQGCDNIFIITGDSGNGLTHAVLGSKIIADLVTGEPNPWADTYSPKRLGSMLKAAPAMLAHDVQINTYYKRYLETDIMDIEDLAPGTGGVLNANTSRPVAVYKDENGKVTRFSAICPHLKGMLCWNQAERTFDCPIHGSRFSPQGVCIMGPAKADLVEGEDKADL